MPQVADDGIFHIQLAFQPVEEISSIAYITGNVIGKAQKAFAHLRQNEYAQTGDNSKNAQYGKHNADTTLSTRQPGTAPPKPRQPPGFHRAHQQVDDICHDHADNDRAKHRDDVAARTGKQPQMGQ